ncbi:hypothetical protein HFD88_000977 [Aspergillus terreus]|nr:hypothetical protein HFD88_000977 [Aspergillus terreus]
MGRFLNAPFAVAQWLAPPQETLGAVGFIMCARVAMALSATGSVFLNLAQNKIRHRFPTFDTAHIQSPISGAGSHLLEALSQAQQQQVLAAIAHEISHMPVLSITSGCFCLCLSVYMDRRKIKYG